MRKITLTILLAATGCAIGPYSGPDAGRSADAGSPGLDAHVSTVDASAALDAGLPPSDASLEDSGRALDGGPPVDSGILPDAGSPVDAGLLTDGGSPDAGIAPDSGVDGGPPGTPPVGTYLYRRLPVGGLGAITAMAFHPSGDYALLLNRTNALHVYDWATETATRIDLDPAGADSLYLEDIVFDPEGGYALIVGARRGSADTGVMLRFDDAAWRAGDGAASVRTLSETRAGELFTGVALPHAGGPSGMGWPVVLSRSPSFPYVARLREWNPLTEAFEGLVVATPTGAGCDGLAFVNNEFGGWGIAVVCGSGSADARYYTEVGGVPEWRPAPSATLGNASRIAAYPGGDYALAIGWSGRRVHRHQGGAWRPSSSAPWFTTIGIWGVAMQQDGRRALIVGRGGRTPLRGAVMEYRHDLWDSGSITDVSIGGFDAPPYNAGSNTYLFDAAFRPGCDGGLIGGGDASGSNGLLIEFEIEGARDCRP